MSLFNFDQETKRQLMAQVIDHAYDDFLKKNRAELDAMLEEMIFWEKKRIAKVERPWRKRRKIDYWEAYKQRYLKGDKSQKEALLKGSIEFYTKRIVGNFSPFVYHLSTKVVPPFLNLLFNALSLRRLFSVGRSLVNENFVITGNQSWVRELSRKGTLVLAPTHLSNLDSIVIGTALHYANLPPVMYGAGLNLFQNKLFGFFMNNLGAYKVDRLRVHALYKHILKEYAASALEMGFHNLFFPGGTRSRSGAVEKRLKLGLLGTTVTAYVRNLQNKKAKPNMYIVPMNLNAHLTLEAETLIDDFLAVTGQSRYIIEDDEFSRPQRLYRYCKSHLNLNSKMFIHFGNPLDPFGNEVNEQGVSVDRHGRPIDIQRYVMKDNAVRLDKDRDRNYTGELSAQLLDIFHRNNRILSTNLVAFTLYEMIAQRHPDLDIYRLLRTYAYRDPIDLRDFYRALARVISALKQLDDQRRIVYSRYLRRKDVQDIVNEALKIFGSYHVRKTIYRQGDQLFVGDLRLLYYYHNRLIGYRLEDMMKGSL